MFKKIVSILIGLALFTNVQAKSLIPGGESAGVILTYDGVLVTGTYAFSIDGKMVNLNESVFENGDLIVSCHNKKIECIDDLINSIQTCINDNIEILMKVKNGNNYEIKPLHVQYDAESQMFKTGLYISDHTTAIGTITYYDPENFTFGAFGHRIDTKDEYLDFEACELFETYITSIERNSSRATGKKIGKIQKSKKIGDVYLNHTLGIFGTYEKIYKNNLTLYETDTPTIGKAVIYTTLNDNTLNTYEIYIDSITDDSQKNISFHVTDKKLLSLTNGIIPGMSGSPIIQNGKIVGAITHVLVNNPTRGYGILIENMLDVAS